MSNADHDDPELLHAYPPSARRSHQVLTEQFRQSMNWLHTWAGVVLGALLFAVFWTSSLSVFDKEIDRWMMPSTRLHAPESVSLDALRPVISEKIGDARDWTLKLPNVRLPLSQLHYHDKRGRAVDLLVRFDQPLVVPEPETMGGSGFIFPFHYSLHLKWRDVGYWIVGLASMGMLALIVVGVIIHGKILVNFFVFRRRRRLAGATLDLHNLTGILGLPFHFLITLSGLIIFTSVYFPQAPVLVYAEHDAPLAAYFDDGYMNFDREPMGMPGVIVSLDSILEHARSIWPEESVYRIEIGNQDDAAAYVELIRASTDMVSYSRETLVFDGPTGQLIRHLKEPSMTLVQRFFQGLHIIQFDHWPLRWLYFALGLSGCAMIATGYIYWLETRRKRHKKLGLPGVRIVEGLTVGSVTGILIATLSFFVANRLLPLGTSFVGYERAALEVWIFYLTWLATFAHAWLRPGRAWREQCWVIAALAVLAPVLNGTTTGDHLVKTIREGYWPVAGMDLLLLAGAGVAVYAARKLSGSPLRVSSARVGQVSQTAEAAVD